MMSPGIMMRGGEKYGDRETIHSYWIMRLHSTTFCLERREWRIGQFKAEMSEVGESDHCFVHNLAANL